MSHSIQLRSFEDRDCQGFLDLMNQVSAPGVFSYVEDLSPHPERFHSIQGANAKSFVALADQRVVGSIGYYTQDVYTKSGTQKLAFVQELRIHPDFRGKGLSEGLGRKLVEQIKAHHPEAVCVGVVERKNQAVLSGVYPRWKKAGLLDFKPVLPFTVFMLPAGFWNRGLPKELSFQAVPDTQFENYWKNRTQAVHQQSLRSTTKINRPHSKYQLYQSTDGKSGYGLWDQTELRSYRLQLLRSKKIPIRYLHDLWALDPSTQNYKQLIRDGLKKCRASGGKILCIAAQDASPLFEALQSFVHFKTEMYLVKDHFSPDLPLGDSVFLEAALG